MRPKKITRQMVVKEIELFNERYGFNPDLALLGRILRCSRQTIGNALGTRVVKCPRTFKFSVIPVIEGMKEDRLSRKMSMSRLAALAHLSPSTISDIENGHTLPTTDTLVKWCNVLGYSEETVRVVSRQVEEERTRRENINEN